MLGVHVWIRPIRRECLPNQPILPKTMQWSKWSCFVQILQRVRNKRWSHPRERGRNKALDRYRWKYMWDFIKTCIPRKNKQTYQSKLDGIAKPSFIGTSIIVVIILHLLIHFPILSIHKQCSFMCTIRSYDAISILLVALEGSTRLFHDGGTIAWQDCFNYRTQLGCVVCCYHKKRSLHKRRV